MKTAKPDTLNKAAADEQPSSLAKPFSEYEEPIYLVVPCGETTLKKVYERIISDELKNCTEEVIAKNSLKTIILPSISPSGVFYRRADDQLISYSNIVHFDFDHLTDKHNLDLDEVKHMLAEDKVLNFSLIYNSPTQTGLKAFLVIEGAKAQEHDLYYSAAMHYMAQILHLEADSSCRNISRACFVSFDPNAWYSERYIKREDLLALLPPAPETLKHCNAETSYVSTATSVPSFTTLTTTGEPRLSDLLNKDPRVHQRAVEALKADGWVQVSDELWRRPGKDGSHSAIYNFFDREGIFFLTNFSSNSPHFGRRGYTDVQIINELEFNSDWNTCITQLAHEYL